MIQNLETIASQLDAMVMELQRKKQECGYDLTYLLQSMNGGYIDNDVERLH